MKSNFLTVKPACFLTAVILLAGCMTAQDYVKKGQESFNFEKSVNYFNRALELEPDNIELRKSIAQEYAKRGEKSTWFDESVNYFNKALELVPDNIELKQSMAVKYIPEIIKNKDKKRADLFEKARVLDPDNMDIYYANGIALLVRDIDFRAAVNTFEEVLKNSPDFRCKSGIAYNVFNLGFKNTGQFRNDWLLYENMSLLSVIGVTYYDLARKDSNLSQAEKNDILDKSLQSLLKGFDLDIVQGKNNTETAKTIYLLQIARSAELKGDYQLAIQYYTAFLNDSSIKFDKTGISDKRQPLYAKAGQEAPAVASSAPPSPAPPPSQQNRPAPIDWTGLTEFAHGVEVGGVYKLKFSPNLDMHVFAVNVPPYIKSVTVFTEGDLDTVLAWGGYMLDLVEMMGGIVRPTDMIIVDDQSATDRNSRITFPTILEGGEGRKIGFNVTEKNGKNGTFTLVIQGNR